MSGGRPSNGPTPPIVLDSNIGAAFAHDDDEGVNTGVAWGQGGGEDIPYQEEEDGYGFYDNGGDEF